jgi:hypothetical protein
MQVTKALISSKSALSAAMLAKIYREHQQIDPEEIVANPKSSTNVHRTTQIDSQTEVAQECFEAEALLQETSTIVGFAPELNTDQKGAASDAKQSRHEGRAEQRESDEHAMVAAKVIADINMNTETNTTTRKRWTRDRDLHHEVFENQSKNDEETIENVEETIEKKADAHEEHKVDDQLGRGCTTNPSEEDQEHDLSLHFPFQVRHNGVRMKVCRIKREREDANVRNVEMHRSPSVCKGAVICIIAREHGLNACVWAGVLACKPQPYLYTI